MGPFAMSAVESAVTYALSLKRKALECRAFGHSFTRPDKRNSEPAPNGGIRYFRHCRECKLPLTWTYYPKDHTYAVAYDYGMIPGYLRTGSGGPLTRDERAAIREVALEV